MQTKSQTAIALGCRCGFITIDCELGSALQEFKLHQKPSCRRITEWAAASPVSAAVIEQWQSDLEALNRSLDEDEQIVKLAEWRKWQSERVANQLGAAERDIIERNWPNMALALAALAGALVGLYAWAVAR